MSKSAVLVGYHGMQNLGDDIFKQVLFNWMQNNLGVTTCKLKVRHKTADYTWQKMTIKPYHNPIPGVSRLTWLLNLRAFLSSDFVVFGAGSIFAIQPFLLMYLSLLLVKVLRPRTKLIALGVSIGPFTRNSDAFWCARALRLFDAVMLRDREAEVTVDSMKNINLIGSFDLALSLSNSSTMSRQPNVVGISITPRGYGRCTADAGHSPTCDALSAAIIAAYNTNQNLQFRLFVVCSDIRDGDEQLTRHLADRIAQAGVAFEIVRYKESHQEEFICAIQSCTCVIALRMHAGIIAMLNGVPTLQISYAEKIDNFFNHCEIDKRFLINNAGASAQALSSFILSALSGDLDDQANKIEQILAAKSVSVVTALSNLAQKILCKPTVAGKMDASN